MTMKEVYKTLCELEDITWDYYKTARNHVEDIVSSYGDRFAYRDLYDPTGSARLADEAYDMDFYEELYNHINEAREMLEEEYG